MTTMKGGTVEQQMKEYVDTIPLKNRWKLDKQLDFENAGREDHLIEIADEMTNWQEDLVAKLGLKQRDVSDITGGQHRNNPRLQRRAALRKWRQTSGFRATYRELLRIFLSAEDTLCAEAVCKVLGSNNGAVAIPPGYQSHISPPQESEPSKHKANTQPSSSDHSTELPEGLVRRPQKSWQDRIPDAHLDNGSNEERETVREHESHALSPSANPKERHKFKDRRILYGSVVVVIIILVGGFLYIKWNTNATTGSDPTKYRATTQGSQPSSSDHSPLSPGGDLILQNIKTLLKGEDFPANRAEDLGEYLGIKPGRITALKQISGGDPDRLLSNVITEWLNNDSEKSWQKLAKALKNCDHSLIAKKISP